MPQVPLLSQRVQTSQIQAPKIGGQYPGLDLQALGDMGGRGDATNRLLSAGQVIAEKYKKEADDLRTTEAYTEALKKKQELLYDQNKGALNKLGKDSFQVLDTHTKEFDDYTQKISEGLSNDTQKQIFKGMKDKLSMDFNEDLNRHTFKERKRYDDEQTKSAIDVTRNEALLSYDNPKKVVESMALQEAMIVEHAKRNGMPEEWVKSSVAEAKSKTHSEIIKRMVNQGNDLSASSYFDKNKNSMTGEDVSRLEGVLEEGSARGKSQRITDHIIKNYSTLEAAREYVRGIDDPKLRDLVDDRVKMEFNMMDKQDKQYRESSFMDASNLLEQNKDINSIPVEQWNTLTPSQRSALRTLEKQINGAEKPKHSDEVYLKYIGMPQNELANISEAEIIEKIRPNVGESYYKEIVHKWNKVKEAAAGGRGSKADKEAKSIYGDMGLILNAAKAAKIVGEDDTVGKLKGDQAKTFRDFSERVDDAFTAYFHENGKNPSDEQKKKIINEMVMKKVFVKKSFLGVDAFKSDIEKPVFTLNQEEVAKIYKPLETIKNRTPIKEMINIARSRGIIDQNTNDNQAERILKPRLERAYAIRLAGGNIGDVINALQTEE